LRALLHSHYLAIHISIHYIYSCQGNNAKTTA